MQESVRSYIHNINTHHAYTSLRMLRTQQRIIEYHPDGFTLSEGLHHYAQQAHYVKSIKNIIKKYDLLRYDTLPSSIINVST